MPSKLKNWLTVYEEEILVTIAATLITVMIGIGMYHSMV